MCSAQTADDLIAGTPHASCRAIVIIPARNEEDRLPATLEALRCQHDADGRLLPSESFEIIVFLNNCTDRSAAVLRAFCRQHPSLRLHWIEAVLTPEQAHVGTARKLLMDLACERLQKTVEWPPHSCAILSTDADTVAAPDWIYCNLEEIAEGADAVGGAIGILAADLPLLDVATRSAYENDRLYRSRVARLESLLDPDEADPWPRHLDHFGASLACTPEMYRRAGGLPCVTPLEDVAFVDAMRRCDARIRHSTRVRVYTSARLEGRAQVGFSGQLSEWREDAVTGEPHVVESCSWLAHRFNSMRRLRLLNASSELPSLEEYPPEWRDYIAATKQRKLRPAVFLQELNCDGLIENMYEGRRYGLIGDALAQLEGAIREELALSPDLLGEPEVQELQLQP